MSKILDRVIESNSVYNRTESTRGSLTTFQLPEKFLCYRRWVEGGFDSVRFSTIATIMGGVLISGSIFGVEEIHSYKIPAQSLNNALVQFAGGSNLEIIFTADMVRGLKTKSLLGKMSVASALDQLLQNTGFTYYFINTQTVTLVELTEPDYSVREQGVIELTRMMVVGDLTETDLKTYQASNSSSATKTDTPIREISHSIQVITRAVMND